MVDDLLRTEGELLRVVRAEGDFLTEIASHLIKAGGKRVRPGFAMASAAVLDPAGSPAAIDVIRGGCAVELVHIGSLYHDDVMDDATTRRSVKSVNAEWGNLRAILAGDYLLGRASELASDLGTEVASLLATTITQLCEGQILELESAYDPTRTVERYERSITGKTASLLATACRIGAIVGLVVARRLLAYLASALLREGSILAAAALRRLLTLIPRRASGALHRGLLSVDVDDFVSSDAHVQVFGSPPPLSLTSSSCCNS